MATWTDAVPFISDGDDGNQNTFNTPLQALTDRTDYLKAELDSLTNKSNLLAFRVETSSDVEAGDLVYFDSDCVL